MAQHDLVKLWEEHTADEFVTRDTEATLRTIDENVSFRDIHAKRGKLLRAEPISALYEQGRVHHVGGFPQLEDQMTTFAGGGDSPDRRGRCGDARPGRFADCRPGAGPLTSVELRFGP